VKGLERNDPNLRKGILDKSVNYFILLFYFKAIKHVKNNFIYFLKIQSKHFKKQVTTIQPLPTYPQNKWY